MMHTTNKQVCIVENPEAVESFGCFCCSCPFSTSCLRVGDSDDDDAGAAAAATAKEEELVRWYEPPCLPQQHLSQSGSQSTLPLPASPAPPTPSQSFGLLLMYASHGSECICVCFYHSVYVGRYTGLDTPLLALSLDFSFPLSVPG